MIDNSPKSLRKVYFDSWHKSLRREILSPMEDMIVDIIKRHPEYHPIFSNANNFEELQEEKFALDHNPFFHLALHVTVLEQVGANRPVGIRPLFRKLLRKIGDQTEVEHLIMECLARILVENFQQNDVENEKHYLEAIARLL